MALTKATAGKAKFKRIMSATETDDNLDEQPNKGKMFDFSDGRFSLTLTIFQILSLCAFIAGGAWFVAAEWRFDVKTTNFKNELEKELQKIQSTYEKKNTSELDTLKESVKSAENSLNNLKIKNPYLK